MLEHTYLPIYEKLFLLCNNGLNGCTIVCFYKTSWGWNERSVNQ